MARARSYPQVPFNPSQRLLATDPSRNQVVRVLSQELLDASIEDMKKSGDVVNSIDTLTEAIAADYASGIYVLVGGGSVVLDGDQAIYRVSDPGSGGIVMDNGNELIILIQNTENRWITAQLGQFMTYGGTANAIELTAINTDPVTSLSEGQKVRFRATDTNPGATTINIDGLGAQTCVTVTGVALPAGYIRTDVDTEAVYDGTNFVVSRKVENIAGTDDLVKSEDGTMSQRTKRLTLVQANTSRCTATWTFPESFSSTNDLTITHSILPASDSDGIGAIADNCAPDEDELGITCHASLSAGSVLVGVYRIMGTTDFIANDEVYVSVRADGYWYE